MAISASLKPGNGTSTFSTLHFRRALRDTGQWTRETVQTFSITPGPEPEKLKGTRIGNLSLTFPLPVHVQYSTLTESPLFSAAHLWKRRTDLRAGSG